jgi:hypothetical protein
MASSRRSLNSFPEQAFRSAASCWSVRTGTGLAFSTGADKVLLELVLIDQPAAEAVQTPVTGLHGRRLLALSQDGQPLREWLAG